MDTSGLKRKVTYANISDKRGNAYMILLCTAKSDKD